jgi:DNA transposition AAA+ family ATPase
MNNFILTKEYKRFVEFCKACQKEKYIGLCYGPAGVGKSMSVWHLAKWNIIGEDIRRDVPYILGKKPSIDMTLLSTIIYTPEVSNTPKSVKEDINNTIHSFNRLKEKSLYKEDIHFDLRFNNYVNMLIIDEAERLQPRSLEQIRDIHDRYQIAVILIGMPGIEKRFVRFPQLYSRIGFIHPFKPLSTEEVSFIVQKHCKNISVSIDDRDFTDLEAIAAITRITQGNFRLITRLLKQALRIMEVNQLSFISKEVIESARECLVIGNIH